MSYIETAVRYRKMMEDGQEKKVTERFVVDALTCTEAEERTIQELTPYVSDGLDVTSSKKVNIADIFNPDEADRFYLAKVSLISIDERSGKEKRTASQWLVGATDFSDAYETVLREINKCVADVEILALAETPVREYFPVKS